MIYLATDSWSCWQVSDLGARLRSVWKAACYMYNIHTNITIVTMDLFVRPNSIVVYMVLLENGDDFSFPVACISPSNTMNSI